jgi:hypothetical protein
MTEAPLKKQIDRSARVDFDRQNTANENLPQEKIREAENL